MVVPPRNLVGDHAVYRAEPHLPTQFSKQPINLTAYFQSERGWFEVRRHINYRDVLVKGLPTAQTEASTAAQPQPPEGKQNPLQPRLDEMLASIARRQERQRKADRLRPLFSKALAAIGTLTEAVNVMYVSRRFPDAEQKFSQALAGFQPLRSALSADPEGEVIVKIFDKALTEYRVLETMIRNQEQLLAARSSSAVDYADRVDKQWKQTRAIEEEMKQAVQETLRALGQ